MSRKQSFQVSVMLISVVFILFNPSFAAVPSEDPKEEELFYKKAEEAFLAGNCDEAIKLLTKAAFYFPDDPSIYVNRASCWRWTPKFGQPDGANKLRAERY